MHSIVARLLRPLYFAALLFSVTAFAAQMPVGTSGAFRGPLGLQLYSLRHHFATNYWATMDKVRDFGFVEIEGSPGPKQTILEWKKEISARGLKVIGSFFDFNKYRTNVDEIISTAKELGVKYVVCGWIPHQKGHFSEADCRTAIEVFNTAGAKLKAAGLTFAYHIHGFEFQPYKDGTLFDLLATETKSDSVKFELDVFWAVHGGADPVALMKKYGNRFELMHIKDLRKGVPTGVLTGSTPDADSVSIGQGQVDWAAVLKQARRIGLKHYFIEDEAVEAVDQIAPSLRYLEKISF